MERIKAVGFDLAGTLYKDSPAMMAKVQGEIAARVLDKRPDLKDIDRAKAFFEEAAAKVQYPAHVFRDIGYEDPFGLMGECWRTDISDLIDPNPGLVAAIKEIRDSRDVYLLTDCSEKRASPMLEAIGLSAASFGHVFYGDNPSGLSKKEGTAFAYALGKIGFSAGSHLYAGDRRATDIVPAKKLGMQTASVWKRIEGADYHLEDIGDIGKLLGK